MSLFISTMASVFSDSFHLANIQQNWRNFLRFVGERRLTSPRVCLCSIEERKNKLLLFCRQYLANRPKAWYLSFYCDQCAVIRNVRHHFCFIVHIYFGYGEKRTMKDEIKIGNILGSAVRFILPEI